MAGVGLFMSLFALSQDYWMLLNPKFRWLTLSAGVGLVICGLAAIFAAREQRLGPLRVLLFLVLGVLMPLAVNPLPGQTGPRLHSAREQARPQQSRATWQGQEYIKLNLGELRNLIMQQPAQALGGHWLLRGFIYRQPQLEARGQAAMLRNAVFCCLADSVALGFVLESPELAGLDNGQWVQVYARLEPAQLSPALLEKVKLPGVFITNLDQKHLLKPLRVVKIDAPQIPYMFGFRDQEPFAY